MLVTLKIVGTRSVSVVFAKHVSHVLGAASRECRDELRLVGTIVRVAFLGCGIRVAVANAVVTRAEDERDATSAQLCELLADTDCVTLRH